MKMRKHKRRQANALRGNFSEPACWIVEALLKSSRRLRQTNPVLWRLLRAVEIREVSL